MVFDQQEFSIRCEWGKEGITQLAPISDVVIIVDVLSFSTCVDVAVARGAIVFPYRFKDRERARAYADSIDAEVAAARGTGGFSLSPASLADIPKGTRLVLPSPNGSTLTLATGTTPTFTACLRNAEAVAKAAMQIGQHIAVIPAGERWKTSETLRPALEDLIGAGAIIAHLIGSLSPEARAAYAIFEYAKEDLDTVLTQCASGKQLIASGYERDVQAAAKLNVSPTAPILKEGAYRPL